MKILITDELSDALLKMSKEYLDFFIARIDNIRDLNKTEFLNLESVIELQRVDNIEMYAYCLEESSYVIFASMPQKKILLVDIVNVIDKNTLRSVVFNKNVEEKKHR